MLTDNEIKLRSLLALSRELGEVDAEKFIVLAKREPFDYTVWQRNLLNDKTIEEISMEAKKAILKI